MLDHRALGSAVTILDVGRRLANNWGLRRSVTILHGSCWAALDDRSLGGAIAILHLIRLNRPLRRAVRVGRRPGVAPDAARCCSKCRSVGILVARAAVTRSVHGRARAIASSAVVSRTSSTPASTLVPFPSSKKASEPSKTSSAAWFLATAK